MSDRRTIESYSIIPSVDGTAVLMVATEDGWTLPGHPSTSPRSVNARVKKRFGLDVTVAARFGETVVGSELVYLLAHQNHGDAEAVVDDAGWISSAAIRSLPFADSWQRAVLEEWFRLGAGVDRSVLSRSDWARSEWFSEASAWIRAGARRHGLAPTAAVEQFESSPYSVTMRMPTDQGYVYFKAAPPEFSYEPELVQELFARFPKHVPAVLAIDKSRSWMLTRGVDPFGQIQPVLEDAGLYERMVQSYAGMQKDLVGEVGKLAAMGVPDRRTSTLPGLLEQLLADTSLFLYEGAMALTPAEHERLLELVPRFEERCSRLAEFNLPDTLQNVDFWRDNIAVTGQGYVFFDWAESIIASPILSMHMLLRDFIIHDVPDKDELRRRLLHTYLSEWTDHEPIERLREAHRLCEPAAILCRALSWRDSLASIKEPRRHAYLWPAVSANVRRLLEPAMLTGEPDRDRQPAR
jgi:hypothetical protein